jgi:hypothetical protein
MMKKVLWTLSTSLVLCFSTLVGLYYLIASPPLHLWYKSLPSAGSSSVYVPGAYGTCHSVLNGYHWLLSVSLLILVISTPNIIPEYLFCTFAGSGFAGFWYHLGTLNQMRDDLHDFDYYCYSSGCLSVVLSFMNTTVDKAATTALHLQDSWRIGRLSSYELVHHFLQALVPEEHDYSMQHFLPRIKVLVTTANDGVQVRQASNRQELVDLLIKTTWIPFVTGHGVVRDSDDDRYPKTGRRNTNSTNRNTDDGGGGGTRGGGGDVYLDGGFSRRLHPPCQYSIHVPTKWSTIVHTLNPGLSDALLKQFWDMGVSNGHPLVGAADNQKQAESSDRDRRKKWI